MVLNVFRAESAMNGEKPEVGKPLPDFRLNVEHYRKSQVSLEDFKGKWLFLEFWYRGCASCIKSLPKINKLQEEFEDDIQMLLVGLNSKRGFGEGIKPLYESLKSKQNLMLPIAYDSVLSEQWEVGPYPYLIVVDPNGTVRYIITGTREVTAATIQAIIQGKEITINPKRAEMPIFNPGDLPNSNGDDFLIYCSALYLWNGEQQLVPDIESYVTRSKELGLKISKVPLWALYNIAYLGKWQWLRRDSLYSEVWPTPLFEMADSSPFLFDRDNNTGYYNYYLIVPPSKRNTREIMATMQMELKSIFGYEVVIEERKMPVWKLVARAGVERKLRTKGGPPKYLTNIEGDGGAGGFAFRNRSIDHLLVLATKYISQDEPPFFNETGIDFKIDINMDVLMTEKDEVIKALRRNKLDLIKGERSMKVLVISDPDRVRSGGK